MSRLVTTFAVLLLVANAAHAQKVVVSEYFNNPGPEAQYEWTELLVLEDNLNLVGWTVHEHSGDIFEANTGPVFKDIPMFRHVRAGTIIVIDHRLTAPPIKSDSLIADGHIQLLQSDANFFQLGGTGMDINQPADMFVVRNSAGDHVHALAHMTPPQSTTLPIWLATPAPRAAMRQPSQLQTGFSVRVTGRSLAAYAAGYGDDSTSSGPTVVTAPPGDPGTGPSKGLPNLIDNPKRLAGKKNVNQYFWRELREPKWSASPAITIVQALANKHTISWTPLVDPYPDDKATGYVVLRDSLGFATFPSDGIRDGSMVAVGDRIGSAIVLAVQPTLDGTTLVDQFNVQCGVNYTYRVYGYRFGPDDVLTLAQTADTTARGRQYTEGIFAQSQTINKPSIPKPNIFASRTEVCPGDTVTLWTDVTTGVDLYEWTRNGVPVQPPGTTTIVVNQIGSYRLKIANSAGCISESDALVISPLPAPTVLVSPTGAQSLCAGDTIWLNIQTPAPSYDIIKNGNRLLTQTSNRYPITAAGAYSVRIKAGGGCDGTSDELVVAVPDVRYHFEPASLDLGKLGACASSKSAEVELVNDGTRGITLGNIVMPAGFALEFPSPGFTVGPGARQIVRVLFAPSALGVTTGTATFAAQPCNITAQLSLRGERTEASASLDKVDVNFGSYSTCPNSVIKDSITFRLANSGTADINVTAPIVSPPFYISFSPITLAPGKSTPITVRFIPFGADLDNSFNQGIAFPFSSSACNDTLRASLRASASQPKVSLYKDTADLGTLVGCGSTFSGTLTLTNVGKVISTITGLANPSAIQVSGLPVDIPQGQTRSISFTVRVPAIPGRNYVSDTVIVDPCGLRLPFTAAFTSIRPLFAADPPSLNLGQVDLCDAVKQTQATFTIRPTPAEAGDTVDAVLAQAPFQTNLVAGTILADSLPVRVTYAPTVAGVASGFVRVVLRHCGDTISVPVRGEALSTGRTTTISGTDFGTLAPGGTAERTIVIRNTGTAAITAQKLTGVVPPWSIVSENPALPRSLNSNDSAVVVLRYSHVGAGRRDTITVLSATSGTCSDTVPFVLTGATQPPDTVGMITGVTLVLPANVVAKPGDQVSFPVALTSQQDLSGKGLMGFSATIAYNPTVFRALQVTGVSQAVASTSISETAPGMATLSVSSTTGLLSTDNLVRVTGSTYLGNARSTVLDVLGVSSTEAVIDGQDGLITIEGDCAINTQVVELGVPASIKATSTDGGTAVVLNIVTLTDDPVVLTVANVQGGTIESLNLRLRPGRHTVTLNTTGWPAGWYGAFMQHGLFVGSAPFTLTR